MLSGAILNLIQEKEKPHFKKKWLNIIFGIFKKSKISYEEFFQHSSRLKLFFGEFNL